MTISGAAVGLVLVLACGRTTPVKEPLVDSRHRPLVLTERRALALPNGPPGTRFVRGWRFEESDDGLSIRPAGTSASIEIVQLVARERDLVLEVAGDSGGAIASVHARAPGGQLGNFDLTGNVLIPLPANLGIGRVPIELEFSEAVELIGATVSAAAPRGRVEVEGVDVIQSGWSAVDFVRWVDGDARLVGELEPPPGMSPNQKFSVVIDRGDGQAVTVFETDVSKSARSGNVRFFDLPLLVESGLVRIRLTAEGRGPSARWRDLRLVGRRSQPTRLPEPAPDPPRLVVVYVFDALRADHIGHLGSKLGASPCIDRLASEGATFTNHYSVAPNTGPATKSLFTGYGFLLGRGLSASGPETLAEVFSGSGFVTASFSSNPHLSPSFGLTRGFDHVGFLPLDQDYSLGGEVTINDSAGRVHEATLRWLDGRRDENPAFLYLHTLNPHNPYTPPEPFPSRFVGAAAAGFDGRTRTLASIRDRERDVTLEEQDGVRQRYTANLAYNDAELCGLVEELERRYPGEVMLAVTSDHGEELFDHDGVLHGYTLYDEMLHVPLVVWWPGNVPPTVIDRATDTLDLHATLRGLVRRRRPEESNGLWDAIVGSAGATGEQSLHFATAPGLRGAAMARSDGWKLILVPRPRLDWGMGRGRGRTHEAEYLFHLESDPGERSNLAGSPSLETDWLWSRLQAWQAAWRARQPQEVGRREIDEATKRQLEALGYVD